MKWRNNSETFDLKYQKYQEKVEKDMWEMSEFYQERLDSKDVEYEWKMDVLNEKVVK